MLFFDLILYNWKKHKVIGIIFILFLTIIAFLVPFQNLLTDGPKILAYYDYNQSNKVDFIGNNNLLPSYYNITLTDYNEAYNLGMSIRYTQHLAIVPYVSLDVSNITISDNNDNNKSFLLDKEITIAGISAIQFQQLESLNLISSSITFEGNSNFISSNLLKLLNLTTTTNINAEIIVNQSVKTSSDQSFNWNLNKYLLANEIAPLNYNSLIIMPIDSFIRTFNGQIRNVDYFIGIDREAKYSLDSFLNYDQNSFQSINTQSFYSTIKPTSGTETRVTDSFFQNSQSETSSLNLITFTILSIPTIIIFVVIATGLVSQWEDELLQNWMYFKSKGVNFSLFLLGFLGFGVIVAFISSLLNFVLYKIIRFVSFSILFNYSSFNLTDNWENIILPSFFITLVISLFALYLTISKLDKRSWKELQEMPYKSTTRTIYTWMFFVSLISVILGIIIKLFPPIESSINKSIVAEFWFELIKLFIYLLAPFTLILGTAGIVSQKYDSIEKIILKVLPLIKIPNLKAIHISDSKRLGFLFVLMFSFQFFLFFYSFNNIYYYNETIINQVGGDYSAIFNGNLSQSEINSFNQQVFNAGLVNSSLISYEFDSLGFSNSTIRAINIFLIENITNIPTRYSITRNDRSIIEKANAEQKGIILMNGVSFNQKQLFLTIINKTIKINLVSGSINLPGFEGDPNAIGLVLPPSINTSIFQVHKSERIFYFSSKGPNQNDYHALGVMADPYADFNQNKFISIYFGSYYYALQIHDSLSSESVLFSITLIFLTIISLFGYIFLITMSINNKKQTIGILMLKGLSKNKLKIFLMLDNLFMFIISISVSFVISYIGTFDLLLFTYPSLEVQLPQFQTEIIISTLVLFVIFVVVSYLILSILVRKRKIINFLSISNN